MTEHKKDYEAIKPKKPPKPQTSKDSAQTLTKTQVSENTTLSAPPKPPKESQVNKDNAAAQQESEDNTQEKPKKTYKLKLPKFRLSTPKIHSNPAETEEHANKKEAPVNNQNPNKISNNMRAKLNYIAEKAGNAFNSVFSSQKRENNKVMNKQ